MHTHSILALYVQIHACTRIIRVNALYKYILYIVFTAYATFQEYNTSIIYTCVCVRGMGKNDDSTTANRI